MTLADELERRAKSDNPHSVVRFVFANLPAIIAALRAQEWQPIETAPRDGTRVLLWAAEWEGVNTGCMFGKGWGQYDNVWKVQPTHWRPLPASPAHDKGEK